jgi:hypothetical protein
MKYNRLVAYGCSHTAGEETQDEDYVPDADNIKKNIGISKFRLQYQKVIGNHLDGYTDAGKRRSYVKHLADKLGIQYSNRAESGSSLAQQIYRLEQDLANNNILDSDLIIIGITSKDRLLTFLPTGPRSTILSNPQNYPEFLKGHEQAFLEHFNDQTVTFYNLMLFQYLLNLAREKLKDQLYFVFCDSWVQDLNYGVNHKSWPGMTELPVSFKSGMQRLQNEFMSSKFIILQQNLYHNSTDLEMHGGNHVKEVVHKRFAEEIYNALIDKQLL